MNKYLNIILISFFTVLTYQYNIGFTLYLPVVFFLINYNSKNIILIIPISLITSFVFKEEMISLIILDLFIIIYNYILKKRSNKVFEYIYLFLVNLFLLIYMSDGINKNVIITNIILSIFSTLIYGYFLYNIEGVLKDKNKLRNYGFIETVIGIIALLGACKINIRDINLGVFVAMFYIMYMSQNNYHILSVFYSIIVMFILKMVYNVEEAIVLPFISAFYIFPSIYGSIILISFCLIGWYVNFDGLSDEFLKYTIGVSVVFELFKFSIINVTNNRTEIAEDVYNQAIMNVNNEVIGFASFLDLYAREFSTSQVYNQKITEGITQLTTNYCECCYKKKECFMKNKGKLYNHFKNMILYSKRSDYNNESFEILNNCIYIVEMRKSASLLNERLNLSKESEKSATLVAQISGISNVLRQYSIDNTLKNEFEYNTFYKIKKAICDYGYAVCYFSPKKILINDFLIEVGIRGTGFNEMKKIVEKIANNYIVNKASVIFQKVERGKTYFNLVPRVNYEIDYGYGSLAQEGNNVCGDNYLVKELNNSKFIAAISDGMGKGYLANEESNSTLKLVDEVTNVDISSSTSLQILNTFYFIQDYLEKYSTLDFVEIDRNKGEVLFYKMGATTSYLFHKDGSFEKIENENLPFGIEEIIETKKYLLNDEDIIVMSSDGVFENIKDEKDLEIFIKGIMHMNPQNITYEILKYAREHQKITEDDMCVITLKIKDAN